MKTLPRNKIQQRLIDEKHSRNKQSDNSITKLFCEISFVDKEKHQVRLKKLNGEEYRSGSFIAVLDDPLDVLLRYGKLKVGMLVEVYETRTSSRPFCRIVGDKDRIQESNAVSLLPTFLLGW